MVAARVDFHVRARRHVAVDALRALGVRFVVVVLGRVVALRFQCGEAFERSLGRVALHAHCVAF